MTDQHPIKPSLILIDLWWGEARQNAKYDERIGPIVATAAAQWGADQELAACAQWVEANFGQLPTHNLHQFRRSKPPSLKEQALLQLDTLNADLAMHGRGCDLSQIRRALEALPND